MLINPNRKKCNLMKAKYKKKYASILLTRCIFAGTLPHIDMLLKTTGECTF